jgi:hypothetical protein
VRIGVIYYSKSTWGNQVIFGKNKNQAKHILRIGVTINISALPAWMGSGETEVPVVPYSKWHNQNNFEYLIFVLPVEEDRDWYFHKNAGEFSHSINASIDLGNHFDPGIDIQSLCDGLLPDLEIELWRGQISIVFGRKLILMAPLTEAANIIDSGNTSYEYFGNAQEQQIEVPVAFDNNWEPTKHMAIYEWMDCDGSLYSNQLACISVDSPKRLVVS